MLELPAAIEVTRRQCAQGRNLVEMAQFAEPVRRDRQHRPWSEKCQIIQGVSALPGEGLRPP